MTRDRAQQSCFAFRHYRWVCPLVSFLASSSLSLVAPSTAQAVNFQFTPVIESQDFFPEISFGSMPSYVDLTVDDQGNIMVMGSDLPLLDQRLTGGMSEPFSQPEGGIFDSFYLLSVEGETVTFSLDGKLVTIIVPPPFMLNGPGTFWTAALLSTADFDLQVDAERISFLQLDDAAYGLTGLDATGKFGGRFTHRGGTPPRVFDPNVSIPNGVGMFAPITVRIDPLARLALPINPDASNAVMEATILSLYAELEEESKTSVEVNSDLDGRSIRALGFFNVNRMSDSFFVFSVDPEDDGEIIPRLDSESDSVKSVPEGSTLGGLLAILGLVAMGKVKQHCTKP